MALSDDKFLFVDLQTTGHAPPQACVIEAAWTIASASDASPGITSSLVAIAGGGELPRPVRRVTGLDAASLEGAPAITDVYQALRDAALAAKPRSGLIHYARFELPFLEALAGEGGLPVAFLCTHRIARKLIPGLPAFGIRAVSGHFGMPLPEAHRAALHVAATHAIWRGLVGRLAAIGVETLEALREWLETKEAGAQGIPRKRHFLVPREVRLTLPESPGVYRMISRAGRILYVGKATSLKARVGSYFVGRTAKGRVAELMAQVESLRVSPTESALEAALLETDEIKLWNPPYNSLLRAGARELSYFSADLLATSPVPDARFPFGPFGSPFAFDSLARVKRVSTGAESPDFWQPDLVDGDVFREGRDRFLAPYGLAGVADPPWLTLGRKLLLQCQFGADEEEDRQGDGAEPIAWTAERVAARLARVARRAAWKLAEARWLCRLADSLVVFAETPGGHASRWMVWEEGAPTRRGSLPADSLDDPLPLPATWRRPLPARKAKLDLAAYDRLRVLLSGLRKLTASGAPLRLELGPGRQLTADVLGRKLTAGYLGRPP